MKDGTEMLAPRARSSGLVVRELDGEVLIYDLERDRALALNRTAGLVWRHCDGTTGVGAMVQLVADELGEPVAEDTIWQALAQLSADHLLDGQATLETSGRVMSRRSMMQKVGLAAAAATITSIVVPTVALALCPDNVCGGGCSSTGSSKCTAGTVSLAGSQCDFCKNSNAQGRNPGSCKGDCCVPSGVCVIASECVLCCNLTCTTTTCTTATGRAGVTCT